jgi:hypothetical protein
MELNKSDLLKLHSYLEGELQARDIVIATLKVRQSYRNIRLLFSSICNVRFDSLVAVKMLMLVYSAEMLVS